MVNTLVAILQRARDILRTEGLKPLLTRSLAFVGAQLFDWRDCYLYEYTLKERNEADFLPEIRDFTFKIVSSNEEADRLAETIGSDFRRRFVRARSMLDKGAIAFCVFIKGEIAHIGWVALSEEAHKAVDNLPYKVDFANHEACTGGTMTIPQYRGKGLMAYGYFKRFEFLKEKGILVSRNAVDKSNIASQKAHAKLGPTVRAEAKYLRLLRWRFWKERPLAQSVSHN
jgi:RimJ/RimL family protein N-acetyltransferase